MRLSRMYYDGELIKGSILTLPRESSHYILNVLRLRIGTKIVLFNGQGGEFFSLITDCAKNQVQVRTEEFFQVHRESALKTHLVQSLSKGEKMDWIIQKAVELGVSEVTPLITEFSSVKFDEQRAMKRLIHWQKIIISACEQSGRTLIPSLNPVTPFSSLLSLQQEGVKLFFHPRNSVPIAQIAPPSHVTLLIGPEGGLSDQEVRLLIRAQFVPVSLGPRILRTETAALTALSLAQNRWGDLN